MNGRLGRVDLFAVLSIGAVVGAFYAPELLGRRSFFFFDVSSLNIPARDWAFRQIKDGCIPAWCTHWYAGFPFIAESQSGVYYPPNYLFFLLFPSWYGTTLAYTIHLWIAGAGAYLLFRRSSSSMGAWLGATAFALGGRLLEHQIHAAVVETIAWLPWILFALIRFIEDGRRRALWWAALAAGIQALAGSLQMVVLCQTAVFVYLAALAGASGIGWRRLVGGFAFVGFIALGLSAALLLPTVELFLQSHRSAGGVSEWAGFGAFFPLRWVTLLFPGSFGSPAYSSAWLDDREPVFETGLYHGGLVVLLGCVGAAVARRTAFAALVLVFVGLSLAAGETNLLGAGLRKFPVFSGVRIPARFLLFVGLGMCQLAALGCDELIANARSARRRMIASTVVLLVASVAALLWMYGGVFRPLPDYIVVPKFEEFLGRVRRGMLEVDAPRLLAIGGGALACFWIGRARTVRCVVVACLLFDLLWTVRAKHPTIDPNFHAEPKSVAALRQACQPDPPRAFVHWSANAMSANVARRIDLNSGGWRLSKNRYDSIGDCLYYERGPLFDVGLFPDVGELPLQPKRLALFRGAIGDPERLIKLLGVSVRMSPVAIDPSKTFYRGAGCVLERVADAPPYAFFTNRVERAPTETVLKRLATPSFNPERDVLLEGDRAAVVGTPQTVRAAAEWKGPNVLQLDLVAPSRGVVLIHEMFDEGWKATVDGAATPIEPANWLFMATPVDAGKRSIVLTYDPPSVRLGRRISMATFAVWLILGFRMKADVQPANLNATPPNPWIALAIFVVVFAASAFAFPERWESAFPTVIPPR